MKSATRIIREEGFSALYRGNLASIIKYFPDKASNLALYDYFMTYLQPNDVKN